MRIKNTREGLISIQVLLEQLNFSVMSKYRERLNEFRKELYSEILKKLRGIDGKETHLNKPLRLQEYPYYIVDIKEDIQLESVFVEKVDGYDDAIFFTTNYDATICADMLGVDELVEVIENL